MLSAEGSGSKGSAKRNHTDTSSQAAAATGTRGRSIALSNVEELIEEIASILYTHQHDAVLSILAQEDATRHYSLECDLKDLSEINQQITMYTCEFPTQVLPLYDIALRHAQRHALKVAEDAQNWTYKPRVHVRLFVAPPFAPNETYIHRVPRSDEVGRWRVLKGTVVRTGAIKMLEWAKVFECNKCQGRWEVHSDREQHNTVTRPKRCEVERDSEEPPCTGTRITEVNVGQGARADVCRDYQEIKVQEPVEKVGLGTIPRSIIVILEDDLVDHCKPGDDVFVTGTVIRRYKPFKPDERCEVEVAMVANHVRSVNEQRTASATADDELQENFAEYWKEWIHRGQVLQGRDLILKSFCPKIYGMYIVKLAIMLVLIGGTEMHQGGMKIRGDCHILLVGDPGTGKSQFLRYASKISPRCVLTTGIGSTNAGLTCAAVKEGGEWQLEAGALVLADRGLCCIDEFGSIREHDKTAIHEAMEQQTISVAKAGLVCKLNTRCSILAATNPKGKYDPQRDLEVNIALASPLLSRFDLVLILLDRKNEEWDRSVSSFILEMEAKNAMEQSVPASGVPSSAARSQSQRARDGSNDEEDSHDTIWPLEKIQAYIAYVKRRPAPTLTDESTQVLTRYYQAQRRSDSRNAARTTIRLLESLIRLAQAHARLLNQREVTARDAVVAVTLMEASLQSASMSGMDHGGVASALHEGFAEDPDRTFRRQMNSILTKLGLQDLMDQNSNLVDDDVFDEPDSRPHSHRSGQKSGRSARAQRDAGDDEEDEDEDDNEDDEDEEQEGDDVLCSWAPTPSRSTRDTSASSPPPSPPPTRNTKPLSNFAYLPSKKRPSSSAYPPSKLAKARTPALSGHSPPNPLLGTQNRSQKGPTTLQRNASMASEDTEPDMGAVLGLLGHSSGFDASAPDL
ncbi:MCM2/3/5 family-domain-containing protein [Phlyctochytrium arcticum]|nr:MCM2/3/5 family-domain-containing protein [Phlyctochytrium arcticum]